MPNNNGDKIPEGYTVGAGDAIPQDYAVGQPPPQPAAQLTQPAVSAGGLRMVTPQPGESFAQTMQRGVALGRTVTPQEIATSTQQGIRQIPAVAGTALLAGPALIGGGMLLPQMAGTAAGGGVLGGVTSGAVGGGMAGAGEAGLRRVAGQPLFTTQTAKDIAEGAVAGGVTGGALDLLGEGGGALLKRTIGTVEIPTRLRLPGGLTWTPPEWLRPGAAAEEEMAQRGMFMAKGYEPVGPFASAAERDAALARAQFMARGYAPAEESTPQAAELRPFPPRERVLPSEYRGSPASAQVPTTVPISPTPVPKGGVGASIQTPPEEAPVAPPRPSPSRESMFPGGYTGGPASAQYPTTVPIAPMAPPKGGVGAFPQITPPEEPPVAPPRPSPPRERILPGEYKGPAASARYPTTVPISPATRAGGASAGGPRGTTSLAGVGGRVGSAGDLASASEENLWAQYMKARLAVERGEPGADANLRDAYANEIARRSQARATGTQVRADVALPGIPGREPSAVPRIEPQRTPPAAQPAPPTAADPVEKFLRGEDLSAEEQLTVSNQLVAEVGPQQARQMMGEYTRNIKRMGGAKVK